MEEQSVNQDAEEKAGGEGEEGVAPQPTPDQAEGAREGSDDAADEASKQSYPASDAPAW